MTDIVCWCILFVMKSFLVRLPSELHEWLRRVSVERGVSMNGFVVDLLRAELAVSEFDVGSVFEGSCSCGEGDCVECGS